MKRGGEESHWSWSLILARYRYDGGGFDYGNRAFRRETFLEAKEGFLKAGTFFLRGAWGGGRGV